MLVEPSSSDEEFELDGSVGNGTGKGVRRTNHNELERRRRQYQKSKLNELRDAIPFLQLEKPSTVLIIQKAKEYIDLLKAQNTEQADQLAGLKKSITFSGPTGMTHMIPHPLGGWAHVPSWGPLPMNGMNELIMEANMDPNGMMRAFRPNEGNPLPWEIQYHTQAMEVERLRRENQDMVSKLTPLDKRQQETMSSHSREKGTTHHEKLVHGSHPGVTSSGPNAALSSPIPPSSHTGMNNGGHGATPPPSTNGSISANLSYSRVSTTGATGHVPPTVLPPGTMGLPFPSLGVYGMEGPHKLVNVVGTSPHGPMHMHMGIGGGQGHGCTTTGEMSAGPVTSVNETGMSGIESEWNSRGYTDPAAFYNFDANPHLRKRRSVIDDDFEAAKRAYFGRRDSQPSLLEPLRGPMFGDEKLMNVMGIQTLGPHMGRRESIPSMFMNGLATNCFYSDER